MKGNEDMGYVFISYSTVNANQAQAMRNLLNSQGISTWMAPGDIPVGKEYAEVITDAVENCSCLVLILSQATQESKWVSREIERAVNYGKTIIPIQIESVSLNGKFELYISELQSVSVKKISNDDSEMKRALKCIIACVGYKYTDFDDPAFVAQKGQLVFMGKYRQTTSLDSEETPLEWVIVDVQDNMALLLSKKCIDIKAFDQSVNPLQKAIPWRDSSLRKWLNGFFFEHVFAQYEKQYICESEISNAGNYDSGAGGTEETFDRVFLLSATEAENYFLTNQDRIALGTEFLCAQNMSDDCENGVMWWLRSPGYYDYRASIVYENGAIDYHGFAANRNSVAIRPAMWIRFN